MTSLAEPVCGRPASVPARFGIRWSSRLRSLWVSIPSALEHCCSAPISHRFILLELQLVPHGSGPASQRRARDGPLARKLF